ncbi:MAG: glycosyltransferase family 4 protein [Deltaproteobacteria bacterium]|nr:glycosyltransferase family 4 protein [Deltaproteobacteria bacterium]
MTQEYHILLLAPYADPQDVGEAWSTFQWVQGITEHFPSATILSLHKHGRSITHLFPKHRVISWEELSFFSRFERFNAMLKPSYIVYYHNARKWIKSEIKKGEKWDLVHQISPLALRYPCPACGLGIPFIIGPLAGSIPVPDLLKNEISSEHWFTNLRGLDDARFRYDPLLRQTYNQSSLVLGVAPYVRNILRYNNVKRFEVMNETGIHTVREPTKETKGLVSDHLKIIYVGRIVRSKGLIDLIRALGLLKNRTTQKIVLNVFGDGKDKVRCKEEACQLGVDDTVIFHGRVEKNTVFEYYKQSDLFVLPSWKEPSGNVVLEAMSFGLPMIVCATGGPDFTVKDSFGIKVPPDSPQNFAKKLADAIFELSCNPQRLLSMRDAAIQEATKYHLWPNKIQTMIGYYNSILTSK